MTLRRPVWALYALVVGLALHNVVMAMLWRAGVRGGALTAISAWKEVLLVAALAFVIAERRALPISWSFAPDILALAFAAFVVVYALIPQSVLGGAATHKGIAYALRHDLLIVGAYFLGRGLQLTDKERGRLCSFVLGTAALVAVFGLVDVYAVSLAWWRLAAGWFQHQLGLDYGPGLSHLPENFVYNAGENVVFRRLTSTFLSPLATAYLLVVAMFFVPLRRRWGIVVAALLYAAILWTHTRAAVIALAAGLILLALVRRRVQLLGWAVAVVVVAFVFVKGYDHFAPRTHFTAAEKVVQERNGAKTPTVSHDPTSVGESSTSEHLASLRDGAKTVLKHPWGFGLGNSGVTAMRTRVGIKAGESTYTELGVETGLAGALVFIGWCMALLRVSLRRLPWLGAAFFAVLVLGLQTDVIGVPWIAVVVWAAVGDAAYREQIQSPRPISPSAS
ncbi:MAG TPA: O-antigen ligase family protein [Gaiellaceae bacterium]|nr:O-antigen ligase family protein [Gaiellaceae bacterium]